MEKTKARVVISGFVQGVFFRHETQVRAQNLGVNGWVMNRRDGCVEAVFEGDKDKVGDIVKWCHKGPSGAAVDSVDVEWQDYKGEFKGFSVEYR